MTKHLWPKLRLKAETTEELKEKYKKIYIETYIQKPDGTKVKIYDWNGNRVRFNLHAFEHAFSESSNFRFKDGHHDIPLSKQRARCVLWIKEVLTGEKGTIEIYNQYRKDSRGRRKKNRVLLVVEENYLVVLEYRKKDNDMQFITAYPAYPQKIQKIKREGGWIETKSPSLSGD